MTGATGSFGTRFVERVLREHEPDAVRLFSRDELKQSDAQRRFADDDRLRYLIGDVRDLPRLTRATRGVDVIVHAAAMKQVPACEYNPFEAVKTNVVGAENVVSAAIENDVPLTLALSTDKAVNPVNLYGATKLAAEKIVVQGNAYAADSPARFANVRYGNVVGSRGSVVPLFKAQADTGVLTITDERMTRFWITLDQAVDFVLRCLSRMGGGEVFVPKIPSMRVTDMAEALAPGCRARGDRHPAGGEAARAARDRGRVAPLLRDRRPLRDPARVRLLGARERRGSTAASPASATRRQTTTGGCRSTSCARWRRRDPGARVSQTFLPYGRQEISDADVEAVVARAPRQLITQGPTVEAFEEAIAGYLGARHAVAFSSGTAALHGASFAAGLGPGDEAIVPPITFVASANCALYQGARPRFVDIEPSTWNLDAEAAVAAADERTRAVVPVTFAGLPVDLRGLDSIRPDVLVIEDACHALGGRRAGAPVGGARRRRHDLLLASPGEGDDHRRGRRRGHRGRRAGAAPAALPHPRDHKGGRRTRAHDGGWYNEMQELGFNYRITDFQCALGLSQLERLDGWVERRNEVAARYRELLAGEERVELPPAAPEGDLHGYHLFVIRVREGPEKRLTVFSGLRDAGIGVQVHYIPVYRLPYYRDTLGYPQDECPATEEYYGGAISLPIFPAMTDTDVERVVDELRELL